MNSLCVLLIADAFVAGCVTLVTWALQDNALAK